MNIKSIKKLIGLGLLSFGLGILAHAQTPAPANTSATEKDDQALIEKLKKDYPLTTCVVSDEKIGGSMGKGIDYLYKYKVGDKEEVRLVRFCCNGCIKDFKKNPDKYLKKIDQAAKK